MSGSRKHERTIPVRWSLFAGFALLVVLIAGAVLTISLVKGDDLTEKMARPLIETAQNRMDAELHRLFDPITREAARAYAWVADGLVERYDPDALMKLFLPGMLQLPQCVSMMVSDRTGYEFTIFRNGLGGQGNGSGGEAGWMTRDFRRHGRPASWPEPARWTLWDERGGERLRTWWEKPSWTVEEVLKHRPSGTHPDNVGPDDLLYDPRQRVWHQGSKVRYRDREPAEVARHPREAVYWTDVDYFFTSKAPGITVSIAARDPRGEMVIVAYDLLLGDLSSFTTALRPTEQGKAFVFTGSGRVIGLPHDERFRERPSIQETILRPVEETGVPELAAGMRQWKELGAGRETQPFRFQSLGRSWWGGIRPFPISVERSLWLGVVLPESDLIGAVHQERLNVFAVALAALLLSMALAWVLSRKYAGSLDEIAKQSQRIAALDLTSELRTSSRLSEIRELSEAVETMRVSLSRYMAQRRQSEEELARAAQEWQTTFDATNDAIWILDQDQRVVRSNKTAERTFGLPVGGMIGRQCWEIVHDTAEAIPDCPMYLTRGSLRREKTELFVRGRWLEVTVDPILDDDGGFSGAVHIVSDITDRKQSEEELGRIFEMSLDMICVADIRTATFLKVNPAFTDILGYSEEELLSRPFLEFVHPEDVEPTISLVEEKLLQGEKAINFVNRYRSRDGGWRWLSWVSHPAPEQGITYAVAHDITEQKEAEEALQQSEERYRSLVENTLDGYFICELPSGSFLFLNQSICDLAGYGMEEGLSLTLWDVVDPEDHPVIRERLQNRMEGRDPRFASHTYSAVRKDGSRFKAEVSTSLVTYQGRPVMQGVLRDVTEEEKLQLQLQQAQKMEAIGTLAGGIAHDFNNLLMGIQGRTSLLMADVDGSRPQGEHLAGIEEYIKSATELTKQLLGFARGGKYEVKPTDLNELIETSLQLFSRTRKEIRIHRKTEPGLWTVEVDRRQIEQVLLNLYINAWQAMPAGGALYLQTRNMVLNDRYVEPHAVQPGRYVKISVTDTGVGMDEATLHKVFDPFFTTKGMGRGTGLGLASAYGIVKNHGGIITVYSEMGEGSTFNIYLPASDRTVIEEQEPEIKLVNGTETVLLVDDEAMVVDVGRPMLERLGYRVLVAKGGHEALQVYEEKQSAIDIVILDMIMPDLNGGETFDRLKGINPEIKVLLSSGYSINGQAQRIIDRGCEGFIQKPFNLYELSNKLREVLDGSS